MPKIEKLTELMYRGKMSVISGFTDKSREDGHLDPPGFLRWPIEVVGHERAGNVASYCKKSKLKREA